MKDDKMMNLKDERTWYRVWKRFLWRLGLSGDFMGVWKHNQ